MPTARHDQPARRARLNSAATRQFIKFAIIGVSNTVLDFIIFSGLHWLGLNYLVANVISFSTAVLNSYYWNRRWTFRSQNTNWRAEMVKFIAVSIIGLVGNEAILWTLVSRGSWTPVMGKIAATAVVLIWNFIANRLWTFRTVALPS
jgi:putative flippase GtrA